VARRIVTLPLPIGRQQMASSAPAIQPPSSTQPWSIDVNRGQRSTRVSSEWFSRPDDEKFLSLRDLYGSVRARADCATTRIVESRNIRVEARSDNPERLMLIAPGDERGIAPTNWSFGQLASLVGAPASYLRNLPLRWPGSISSTGLSRTAANRSNCCRPKAAVPSCERPPGRTMGDLGSRAGERGDEFCR
jgi:hypothetical protein